MMKIMIMLLMIHNPRKYISTLDIRKPRNVRSVIGCELSRQLNAPGAGCVCAASSMAAATTTITFDKALLWCGVALSTMFLCFSREYGRTSIGRFVVVRRIKSWGSSSSKGKRNCEASRSSYRSSSASRTDGATMFRPRGVADGGPRLFLVQRPRASGWAIRRCGC